MGNSENTPCSNNTQGTAVEHNILEILHDHPGLANPIIDISLLQEKCLDKGISIQEFSYAFVQLLTRRLIEPHGEFRYVLSPEGQKLRNSGTTGGNPAPPRKPGVVPQSLKKGEPAQPATGE